LSNKKNEDVFEMDGGQKPPKQKTTKAKKDTSKDAGVIESVANAELNEVAQLKEQLVRQAAEYDNYRKRTAKERLELVPEITAGNVTAFLGILDNIERALHAECSDANYKKGIEMVHTSFVEALKNLGVEEITTDEFDPGLHQAVQHIENDSLKTGDIAEVFQKGYKIENRIIRFAMVAIVK